MRTRLAAFVAALATCLPAHAAPPPQIVDPVGDAVALGASYDVVSAVFTTSGKTVMVKKRSVYVPTALVVRVTYAGDVAADPYAAQVVRFTMPACGRAYLESYADTTYGATDCVIEAFQFGVKAAGRTVTFTVPFATIGSSYLRPGVVLRELETWTSVAEPQNGYETGDLAGSAVTVDFAKTDKTYMVR